MRTGLGDNIGRAVCVIACLMLVLICQVCSAATTQPHYYGHDTVEDQYGVIAPWYTELNGQCDFRVRIAAETLKRYPWTTLAKAVTEVPEYVFNPGWTITADGTITPSGMGLGDGDLGCRAWVVLYSLVNYHRYSGDPAAIAHMTYTADVLLDYCLTPADHPWPGFLISAPFAGVSYGQANPHGYIQLDFTANCGIGLIEAYRLTGTTRYLDAAKHWADLLAQKRNTTPGADPWGRYANPEDVPWCTNNKITGGVASFVLLFDELIRLGYTGTNNEIVEARDAALAYIRDRLLPAWTVDETWGRNYNDWDNPVQGGDVSDAVSRVMMAHKDYFPNWRTDVRNILSLFLNHTSVYTSAGADVYSGSWAYPESSSCCGRSLWYATLEIGASFAHYGVEADSDWGRELGRRQEIHSTYDIHESGVTEDNIDGGCIVNGGWFKIAVPEALWSVTRAMSWLPEELGANRENHIMRTSGTVTSVVYRKGRISYSTFDAPANSIDVLRLAFTPTGITADGNSLTARADLSANGFTLKTLPNGDCIVGVRHDGSTSIVVTGTDPQTQLDESSLAYSGAWALSPDAGDYQGSARVCSSAGASASYTFPGNQVRLTGRVGPAGGLADVYLDGVKQLVFVDCYSPVTRYQQVLYYKNGLTAGSHSIRVVVRGAHNAKSGGANIYLDSLQFSSATGSAGYGSGGGPAGTQRWIFGYPGNQDYTDSAGNAWRPATEWTSRLGTGADVVAAAWWTQPAAGEITNTPDPELYRYGAHATDFTVNFTVGPGTYHARLKFAANRGLDPAMNTVDVLINGQQVVTNMDVDATAGGANRAVDLVFNGISPRNGIIEIRFASPGVETGGSGEAFVQAIEVGPGDGGVGATPVTSVAQVTGTVRREGQPLPGATVTASGKSATTDQNGFYSLVDLYAGSQITAGGPGCWPENKFGVLARGANTVDFDLRALPANQLLANGDFESPGAPYIAWGNSGSAQDNSGWTCRLWSSGSAYLRRESTVFQYNGGYEPDGVGPGPWRPFSGTQCSRQTANPSGQHEISQTVWAKSLSPYKASVMVKRVNLGAADSVGLHIQELDSVGAVVLDHSRVTSVGAAEWTRLSDEFTTLASTAKIRYALETSVTVPWWTGWADYDVAVLDGSSASPPTATVAGTVRTGTSPVSGAVVTVGGKTATSGTNGVYSIAGVAVNGDLAGINVHYAGFVSENKWQVLAAGTNTVDFDLVAIPANNLLANPGFENTQAPYKDYDGAGTVGTDQSWTFRLWVDGSHGGDSSYLRRESSVYKDAAEPLGLGNGPWTPHSGTEASRHCTSAAGHLQVYQDVPVSAGTLYAASVWLKAVDIDGSGFGLPGSGDSAGLHIIELAANGSVVLDHSPVIITTPTGYTQLAQEFTTQAGTAKVRFMMETYIGGLWNGMGHWQHGWVTYDDAALCVPPPYETVSTVAALKARADGSQVRVSGKVVSSSFDGFFYIEEGDRTSGIKVTGTAAPGSIVEVVGAIRTGDGERTLVSNSVSAATGGTIPKPLGMSHKSAGLQAGLPAVGLYVAIWGRVDAVGGARFTLTDGSGADLSVQAPSGYAAAPNDYVKVIGALGAEKSGSAVLPVVRAVDIRSLTGAAGTRAMATACVLNPERGTGD